MFSSRLVALVAVALGFVAAQDSATIDDTAAAWKFSAGSSKVTDNNSAVRGGSYTVVPVGGSAEVTFVGSGATVSAVTLKGSKGAVQFFLDGNDIGSSENVNAAPSIQYGTRLVSSHGHAVGTHTIKVVAQSMPIGIDALLFNPGQPSAADPDD